MIQKQSECQRSGLKKMPHLQPKMRRARFVGRQMWAIFFRSSGFIEAVALEDRKTITADWHTTVCLPKVITAIESQIEKTGIRGILLHHDNASSHTVIRTREFLENSGLKTLPHPPYSPDLAPCDFWLFPRLKDQLRGRRYSTNEELRGALFQAIGDIPKEEWKNVLIIGLPE
ncbi:Histone-lysine N-methyltransferase SETMAR-like [Oopsacas minuta]|uniref:Histone-lysine N-methyltransferase SETMAR-like n=1 Tax=Oopsacas minuta TaxID=111878 RepID=A0AAV7JG47_9METZ|nr:Histone-lysine N-methyltransferase SETMAR-like [Oopsacas minuta]